MPPTKNIPSAPSFVKTLEHGRRIKVVYLNLFNHPIPSCFGVNDEYIPNPMLDLRLIPLFMFERFVIAFDPNGSKCNTPKEVPNFILFCIFWESFPQTMFGSN